jgi:small subunit ribosomal protein S2
MAPYIYMERNGIHIISLYKTVAKIEEASEALKKIAASGRKILFVATKKQAKDIVSESASKVKMPYITERWPGGMLTNFVTIRKAVKKMASIDRMKKDGTFETLSKKERLQVERMRAKLEKNLGSINDMTRLPGALFVVDIKREHIAIKEAQKLKIPIFAMVDTNSDPREVEYVIPSNDDATKSIEKILSLVTDAVAEGLQERKNEKEASDQENQKEEGTAANTKDAEAPVKAVKAEAAEETQTEEAPAVENTAEETPAAAAENSEEEVPTEGKEEK